MNKLTMVGALLLFAVAGCSNNSAAPKAVLHGLERKGLFVRREAC